MKNIYCARSRLSSLCLRAIIERYVAGDTASEAKRFLSEQKEPIGAEADFINREFLAAYPISWNQINSFVELRSNRYPERYREIRVSRQTINDYFLRLGRYCWDQVVEPHLRREADQVLTVLDETSRECGVLKVEVIDLLVRSIARRYVQYANGTLLADPEMRLRYGDTIIFLTGRAQKLCGLSVQHSREHMAWAFVVNSVQAQRGTDDRTYGARYLTSLLMKRVLE